MFPEVSKTLISKIQLVATWNSILFKHSFFHSKFSFQFFIRNSNSWYWFLKLNVSGAIQFYFPKFHGGLKTNNQSGFYFQSSSFFWQLIFFSSGKIGKCSHNVINAFNQSEIQYDTFILTLFFTTFVSLIFINWIAIIQSHQIH